MASQQTYAAHEETAAGSALPESESLYPAFSILGIDTNQVAAPRPLATSPLPCQSRIPLTMTIHLLARKPTRPSGVVQSQSYLGCIDCQMVMCEPASKAKVVESLYHNLPGLSLHPTPTRALTDN